MTMLRVATVNILNDLSRWEERRPLLVAGLRSVAPDLIALQEVANPLGASTSHQLAAELTGYSVHVGPKTGSGRSREGIAVLSRLAVDRVEDLDLLSQQRVAQIVQLRVGGRPVAFVNGHYYWPPFAHQARLRQVSRVLDRLRQLDPATAIIVGGDFNGLPGSPAIALVEQTLVSAYKVHHGQEPAWTCPTPLTSRNLVRGLLGRVILRICTNHPGQSWRGTLDYLFVSPDVRVVEANLFLDRPGSNDPTLYPSDHLGLVATLDLDSSAPGG